MSAASGPVVAITGAAGGIGHALARVFGDAGYALGLCDVDAARLEDVAKHLEGTGLRVHAQVLDLRENQAIEAWAQALRTHFGRIDVLINNAGTLTWGVFADMSEAEVDLVLDLNLKAALHACRIFAPHLREAPRGHIVNISSMSGLFSSPFQTTYCASKWGLRGFSQGLRMELRTEGIGVTCVMPGTIATDFMARAQSHNDESMQVLAAGMHKVGASPERVATKTLRAVRWNFGEQLVGIDAYLVAFVQRFLPGLIPFVMNRVYPVAERKIRTPRE